MKSVRKCGIAGLLGASLAAAGAGLAAAAGTFDREQDCFHQLEKGRGAEIVCAFPTRLSEQEQSELKRITGEMLLDAHCIVSIRLPRRMLDAALGAGDHVFEAPPQPVSCEVVTRESTIPISGTFAPRVVFAGGQAVEATPGLANVAGVSSVLAWPVLQYVNRSGTIREGMLTVINAWRLHLQKTRQGAGREARR